VVKTRRGIAALEVLALEKVQDLRYGENPHQRAALYQPAGLPKTGVAGAGIPAWEGTELQQSPGLRCRLETWFLEFDLPAAAVIKHTNPSGVANADTLCEAYVLARECDPVSAF